MKLEKISEIEFVNDDGDGEAGYFVYLKDGYSFDPMSNDSSTFIPVSEFKNFKQSFVVYQI